MTKPRQNILTWDEKFMGFALLASKRSRDPSTQVGAFIANANNLPVASGYNGFPRGISNDEFPWDRDGDWLDTKYPYMCHAEQNAIDNRGAHSLRGCKIYVTLYPCNDCAKRIIQNGITEVVYLSNKYKGQDEFVASERMFKAAKIKVRQLKIKKTITLELKND